ncbi:MAG: peptidoglycan-binding protein, partial [Magnetococcales bacterium]|nr:peptidoglycan-binding protein [Magnetococcales bacterium]
PGSTSIDVLWLRNKLEKIQGIKIESDKPNYFDKELRRHVRVFQKNHNIFSNGVVGTNTLIKLEMIMPQSSQTIPQLTVMPARTRN